MASWSLKLIAKNPTGNACYFFEDFEAETSDIDKNGKLVHMIHFGHAHNLIIQEYRERGWIWGSVHFLLWILALIGAWREKTYFGSSIFAGLTTIFILGLVDYPWPVLNHSIFLWIYLLIGLGFYLKSSFKNGGLITN